MANNKKFIVKNGLESQENVVIGTTTDDGVNRLQVTGSSKFTGAVEVTQSNAIVPTVIFTNSAGPSSLIAQFAGASERVNITNFAAGDYSITNSGQNNGIRLFNDTAGVDIIYNGNTDLEFNAAGIDFKREPRYLGNVFWNAGNDGPGSGLDADLLDGLDSAQFLRSDENDTMNGSLIITGNLTVNGTTTTLNTETILLADNIITLNSNYTGSTPTENGGIEVERGTLVNSTFQWLEASDKWELGGPSLGLILGDTTNRSGALTSYANSFIIEAGGATGVSSGTVLLSGRLFGTAANAGVAAFHNPTTNISYGELLYNGSPRIRSTTTGVSALGNSSVIGTLTVGTGSGGAFIYMDGAGTNGTIYSSAGEIGFLNAALNYALKVDTAGDVRVTDDIFAQKFIDINNNTYQVVPSVTSVLNNIDLEGALRHNGDTGTLINFPEASRIGFSLGGIQYGLMSNTAFQYTGDVIGDRFVDRNNNAYLLNPAEASVLNTVGIDSDLFHNGDTDNKISFGTDTQTFQTGGATRLTINNTSVTSTVDVVGPRFVDSNNNAFFLDPASTSELNSANFYSGSANNAVNIGISAAERFNIDVTGSQGYIRYIQNETNATDNSVNFEIISSGIGLNRFNFNKNVDVGSNSISGGFGVFSSGVYASVFYDYENEAFFADLNNTGNSINVAGTIRAGDGTLALPSYTFGSDTNTGMYRIGADTLGFSAGGNDEFRINTTFTLSPGSSRAPIFYDSNNTAYYGDFASTSVMNRVGIDDYIQHNGNTTTYLGFSANNIFKLFTNGVERLNVDDNSADFSVDVYAPRYYDSNTTTYYGDFASTSVMNRIDIDDYIRHNGNVTSYFGFSANNIYKLFTNGVERLNVDDNSADFSVNVYAPQYYTNDYLIHNGDTNTYVGFDANDQFGVWTNGVKQINVSTTAVAINLNTNITGALDVTGRATIGNSLTRPANLSVLTNSAARIGGSDVHLHIASLDGTGNFAVAMQAGRQSDNASFPLAMQPNGGNVSIGTLTAGATLTVNKRTAQGNNPFVAGTSLLSLGDVDVVDYSIRTDSFGNIFHVNDNGGNQIWYNTSGSGLFGVLNTGDVVVNNDSTTYAVTDAATNFIAPASASNNKLHVTGSISLPSINDVISIYGADGANTAINEATFLGVNELGFSAGGGFFMNETTTMRVRGNKSISTTGDITGARFIDANNNAYIVDPASTSVMNRIDLDDYIRHNGDTDTYFGFAVADTFRVFTGGTQRLNIDNDSADFGVNVYAPIFYDSDNNAYFGDFGGTSNMSRIDLDDYIRHRGNTDAYFGWAANNNFKLFTNNVERFNVDADSADFSVNVFAPRYVDSNDTAYYVDPASVSIMNNVSFGVPGNGANVKGRFLSIEGNTDTGGEGSSRIFFAEHNATTAARDLFGMALAYRGGAAAINSVTGQPVTLTGLSDGQWGLLGYDNNVNGNWAMRGPRSSAFVEARGDFRAPIFYDSNNTAFYGDFASTSIMNVVRVQQLQVDQAATFIDGRAGDYGTIRVEGTTAAGSWAGYAIRDDWVFMSNGPASAGIYNDTDNEWSLEAAQNSWTRLYANGVHQIGAENGFGFAPTSMRSPIFYDSDNTNYFANFAAGNTGQAIKVNGRIFREGYAADGGSTNMLLQAQDENQFIWNTATNWGIFWATNTSASYRYAPFGDNMISFVGAGNLRAAIDLDNGAAYFQGAVTAADFRINGGNEDLGILKTYGSGLGDTMMFDGTEYWEKRVIKTMQGAEDFATDTTAEYVKNNNGPFASTYALRTNQYRTFDSDYIPVEPGEQIYGEIAVRYISGSGGLVYMGVRRYDKDKLAIAGNDGIEYFVVSGNNVTATGWTTYSGHTTIPTSHTPFSGSDGGACKYVRIIVLMNYPNGVGPAVREYGPPILKRVNHLSNVVTDFNLSVGGDATITGDLTVDDITADVIDANIFRDRADASYYLDPASTAQSLRVRGEIQNPSVWINDGDNFNNYNENIRLFNAPNGVSVIAFSASGTGGTPTTSILGFSDRLETRFGSGWQMRQFNNTTQFVGDVRATIFYDINDTTYYADPASTSLFNALALRTGGLKLERAYGDNAIWFNGGADTNHVLWNQYFGGPNARGGAASGGFDGIRWNTYEGLEVRGGPAGAFNIARFRAASGSGGTNTHFVELYANNVEQLGTRAGFALAPNDMRSPIFYDNNNTGFYGDFASTTNVNTLNAEATTVRYLGFKGVGGDSGQPTRAYEIYQEGGAWTFPYPDLRIAYHTGIKFGANSSYNGMRFYNDYDMSVQVMSVNNANDGLGGNNVFVNNSLQAGSSLRAPIFYDSNDTTYFTDPATGTRFGGQLAISGNNVSGNVGNRLIVGSTTVNFSLQDTNLRPTIHAHGAYPVLTLNHTVTSNTAHGPTLQFTSNGVGSQFVIGTTGNGTAMDMGYSSQPDWNPHNGISGYNGVTFFRANTSGNVGIGAQGDWGALGGGEPQYAIDTRGTLYNNSDIRAPIFYDANNTAFYGDFASTSVLNTLRANLIQLDGSTYTIDSVAGDYGSIKVNGYRNGWAGYSINDQWVFMSSGAGNAGIFNDTNNNWAILAAQNSDVQIYFNGTWEERSRAGYMEARGAYYAPIFYDSNNTAYRIDGNGTSRLLTLNVDNVIGGSVNGYASFLASDDNRIIAPNEDPASRLQFGFTSWNNNNTAPYADYLHLRSYGDASGGNDNLVVFNKSSIGMRIWQQTWNSGTAYSTFRNVTLYNENPGASNDLYASIYYDSNDTTFRVDPNGVSTVGQMRVSGRVNAASYINAAIEVREFNYGGAQADTYAIAPRIGFHWGGRVASQIAMASNGEIRILNNPGTATENFRASNITADQAFFGQLYYDSNNTGFYTDPASTSVMNILDIRGEIYNDGWFRSDTVGRGMLNTGTQMHWYSDTSSRWRLYSTTPTSQILFTTAGDTARGYVYADFNNNIGFLNQNFAWALRTNGGTTEIYGDLYANIMYDRNNTGFYVDPASTTRLNVTENIGRLGISNYIVSRNNGGMMGDYNTNGTASKVIWTIGESWPIGNMYGLGYQYGGFGPYGTQHQIVLRENGTTYTQFGMAGNMHLIGSGNATGDFRAPIFYDSNDTNFYVDPNSTARLNTLGVGLVAQNGGKLSVTGGHGDSTIRLTAQGNQLGSGVTSSMHWWMSEPGVTWNDGGFGYNVTNDGGTPAGFGRPNTTLGQGYMRYTTGGNIIVYNTNTSGTRFQNMEFISNGTVLANNYLTGGNSLRAPIFYDSNNTGFYVDPNGTSNMNAIALQGILNVSNPLSYASTGVTGLTNAPISTRNNDVNVGTTSRYLPLTHQTALYNEGYRTHVSTGLYKLGNSGWGDNNTGWYVAMGGNDAFPTKHWKLTYGTELFNSDGFVSQSGSFRAPIFYDSNNTGYYFDGASDNSTRMRGIGAEAMAFQGLSGQVRSSKEYYAARPRITGDQNYWTGAVGWGTVDMNTVADWGSGFFDSWSNPANQPSGSSHWVGTQAYHYTNGSARYGWQLAGGPIGNLRFRQTWGGFGAWRTVPMLNVNDGNVGAMYANIYYDSDNTGFYVDPTDFTNLNTGVRATTIYAREWIHNDQAGRGLYNGATGAYWYSTSSQYWHAAGNNNAGDMNIRGMAAYQGNSRFWLHGATDGYAGFLNSSGSWLFRMSHNAGLSPGMWFYEAGESWTGNIGADKGKIEYHANRMYIVSGSNSDRIVQFRRDGGDVSWIANDGVFVGTATSARWADLAERYEADAIYEAGTVLAIGGDKEVTLYQPGMPLAGAISVKPAYRMNDENYGNDNSIESKMNPFVALKGRIPVLINGSAKKGQWIIADAAGRGRAVDYGTPGINTFDIIGIAISDSNGVEVEVKI